MNYPEYSSKKDASVLNRCRGLARIHTTVFVLVFALLALFNLAAASDCKEIGLKVKSVSTQQAENPGTQSIDGNYDTRWSGNGSGANIVYDLGSTKPLCETKIAWYNGGVNGRLYSFQIEGSTDGVNFTRLYSGKSQPNSSLQTYSTVSSGARYIRLTVYGNTVNNWASVLEVKVLGKSKPCANLTPKYYIVSNQPQADNPASNTWDFDFNTRWSSPDIGSTLDLDYGKTVEICGVKTGWYNGGVSGRVYNYEIYTSEDGRSYSLALKQVSEPNTAWQFSSFNSPVKARYLRLKVNGNTVNNWASVTEFHGTGREVSSSSNFKHPGILMDKEQIEKVKASINGNGWRKSEFNLAMNKAFPRGIFINPNPPTTLVCNTRGKPCEKTRDDAYKAYTAALGWVYTGDRRYATEAIKVLDLYAARNVRVRGTHNVALQTAWMGEMFAKTAELIRHTDAGWPEERAVKFGQWMKNQLLPTIRNGWGDPGNWTVSMANATMSIGVYLDDRNIFNSGVKIWRNTLPSSIYLRSDGNDPIDFSRIRSDGSLSRPASITTGSRGQAWRTYWGTRKFIYSGHNVETCRDTGHAFMVLYSYSEAAQTAHIQGLDLYKEGQKRLVAGFENLAYLTRKYLNVDNYARRAYVNLNGSEVGMCDGGQLQVEYYPALEVGYAYYHGEKGINMPNTKRYLELIRQAGQRHKDAQAINRFRASHFHSAWTMLTHGLDSL